MRLITISMVCVLDNYFPYPIKSLLLLNHLVCALSGQVLAYSRWWSRGGGPYGANVRNILTRTFVLKFESLLKCSKANEQTNKQTNAAKKNKNRTFGSKMADKKPFGIS